MSNLPPAHCAECGARLTHDQTCADAFHQMLAWELEHQLYDVHHFVVLCYHLQHPSLYSPEGLNGAKQIFLRFLDDNVSPQQMREDIKAQVDSSKRQYKIAATADSYGRYAHPIVWKMWAWDVVNGGMANFYSGVRAWAKATREALQTSHNLD